MKEGPPWKGGEYTRVFQDGGCLKEKEAVSVGRLCCQRNCCIDTDSEDRSREKGRTGFGKDLVEVEWTRVCGKSSALEAPQEERQRGNSGKALRHFKREASRRRGGGGDRKEK